ncbi:calmodulin-binding protein isoform X2 [Carex rostrata]
MEINLRFSLLLMSLLFLIAIPSLASIPLRDSLGISPQDESYYKAGVIKCKDGSKKFSRDLLNDEFCDCPDGTDEPGTSACPEGKFYCQNSGHAPLVVFSSRVNDGICDCCDGSDEYDGKVNCSNTCWEAGKVARDKLKKKIATYQDGLIMRNKEVEKAKLAIAKDEEELSKLTNEEKSLRELVGKLKEQKERIEKAENEEKLKKELEEKRLKEEAEKQAAKEKESIEASLQVESKDANEKVPEASTEVGEKGKKTEVQHEGASYDEHNEVLSRESPAQKFAKMTRNEDEETKPGNAEDKLEHAQMAEQVSDDSSANGADAMHSEGQEHGSASTGGFSKEELGRLVASRWTGEKSAEKDENPKDESQKVHTDDVAEPAEEEENYDSYNSDTEDDRYKYKDHGDEHKYDDEYDGDSDEEYSNDHADTADAADSYKSDDEYKSDHSDTSTHGGLSWIDKIQQTVQRVLQSFNFFKTPVDLSEASRIKKEYDDLNSKLSKIQSRIHHLKEKNKHDFGNNKQFYSFYDQCFEYKENKYVYKVCPFKKATQNEGHSSTQLGRWDKFEDSYRTMVFANGDHCWNGPDRSLKVRLRCGLKNEVADVDEPSRCEYVAVLSTPAMCAEEKLKELKQKLADMNSSQQASHDEL